MSDTRQHVHELIDRLPTPQLTAVAGLLEAMLDPVLRSLANAPLDDEPVTEEDRRRIHEGQAWFAQRGGKGIPMEEVLAEFGPSRKIFLWVVAEGRLKLDNIQAGDEFEVANIGCSHSVTKLQSARPDQQIREGNADSLASALSVDLSGAERDGDSHRLDRNAN
jgi:hypothetical protein